MANNFFSNFPLINYALPGTSPSGVSNGSLVLDITQSVKFDPSLLGNVYFFNSSNVMGGERADQLSQSLYSTPFLDWSIWMSNQEIDPYNWYMDQSTFYSFITEKYGDYDLAQQKVSYYINNWYDGTNLTVGGYNSLDPSLTKFYQPQIASDGITVLQYVRTPVDWTVSTNHVLQFIFVTANSSIANTFVNNEICQVTWDSLGNTMTGQFVSLLPTNSTCQTFTLQHLNGNYAWWSENLQGEPITDDDGDTIITEDGETSILEDNSLGESYSSELSNQSLSNESNTDFVLEDGSTLILEDGLPSAVAFQILGTQSNSVITIATSNALTGIAQYDSISAFEDVYYDPVTQFDYENILNENKKYIKTLVPSYIPVITQELKDAF